MSDRLRGLLADAPNEPVARTHFGFRPAVELRYEPTIPGELIEVTEDGRLVGQWILQENALAVEALNGRSVTILPGFPECAKALRAGGAEVTVHPWKVSTLELAQSRTGAVDYL